MNLAFLGFFSKGDVYPYKTLYHWPDGVWLKKHIDVEKIPGRDVIKYLKIPKRIRKIVVLGNLSKNSEIFLRKKFNLEIINKNLPFGSIEKIKKTKIKLPTRSLTFITLPTPKQEKLAYHLAKKNSQYKIICIGASIAIASGEEKQVPNILKNYEGGCKTCVYKGTVCITVASVTTKLAVAFHLGKTIYNKSFSALICTI